MLISSQDFSGRQSDVVFTRVAQASGAAIDSETRRPVANITLVAWRVAYREGVRSPELAETSKPTGPDGRFEFKQLTPGNYLFQIMPRVRGSARVLKKLEAEDRDRVDEDIDSSYWPGGADFEFAGPVAIAAGDHFDLGAVPVKQRQLYRIEAIANADPCRDGDKVLVGVRTPSQWAQEALGDVACGGKFLVTGFAPGSYLLNASVIRPEGRLAGVAPFEVGREAAEVAVSLVPGVDLALRIALSQDAHSPFPKNVEFRLFPLAGASGPTTNAMPKAKTDLHLKDFSRVDYRIAISGLSAAYCLKEIRHNGNVVPDNVVRLSDSAMPDVLEIELGDKPAAIVGAVTVDDRPVANPYVVAVRWPFSGNIYNSVIRAAGDAGGNFQIPSLAAGTYRVAAILGEAKDKLEEPGVMEALLAHGESVTLDAGSVQRVILKAADPLH